MRLDVKLLTTNLEPGICFINKATGAEVAYLTPEAIDDAGDNPKIRGLIFKSVVDVIEHSIPNLTSTELKFINSNIPNKFSDAITV